MEDELKVWKNQVFQAREKFYELNYFTTTQLLSLRQELGALNASSSGALVPSNILVLLQSISSEVTSEFVCDVVKGVADNSAVLEQSSTHEVLHPVDSATPSAAEDHEKNEKPTITEEELTDEQKSIMIYVLQRLECSKALVLKAFEENKGKDMNKNDFKKWCSDNLHVYDYEDEDGDISEDDSVSQQGSEDPDGAFEFIHSSGKTTLAIKTRTFMVAHGFIADQASSQNHGVSEVGKKSLVLQKGIFGKVVEDFTPNW